MIAVSILLPLSLWAKPKVNNIKDIDAVLIQDKISIGVKAPKGYALDQAAISQFGMCAFYSAIGKTFNDSPAIIYSRISANGVKDQKGIDHLVNEVSSNYKKLSKDFKLETLSEYTNKKGEIFTIKKYLNGPTPNEFEVAGYLAYKDRIFFSIMSTKSKKDLDSEMKAFYDYLDRVEPYTTEFPTGMGNCLYPNKDQKKK